MGSEPSLELRSPCTARPQRGGIARPRGENRATQSRAERSGGAAASAVVPERAAPGSWPVRPHQDQGGAGEAGPELGPGATSAEMLSQSIFGEDHSAR